MFSKAQLLKSQFLLYEILIFYNKYVIEMHHKMHRTIKFNDKKEKYTDSERDITIFTYDVTIFHNKHII